MTRNGLKGRVRRILHEYTKGKSTNRLEEAREVILLLVEEEIDSYLNRRSDARAFVCDRPQSAPASPQGVDKPQEEE